MDDPTENQNVSSGLTSHKIQYALRHEFENADVDSAIRVYENIRSTLANARVKVINYINSSMVLAYWNVGKDLADEVGERAEYGKQLLKFLSERLTVEFGKGFDESNLRNMRKFYTTFPNRDALRHELSWTQYRSLMRIDEPKRREFYLNECAVSGWTSRKLDRQINSFYYERLLATQQDHRLEIINEIHTTEPKTDLKYIIKDPYVLEFLDLNENKKYTETELEQGLIDKLQEFLLELGKGFSFVARQKRITSEGGTHYFIDLTFYNYILKCFVVIDLKTSPLTYQDVGQLDFYVRLFNDKIRQNDDNPTIGIILCTDKDESIVKYSVLADNENLFASKYRLFLPTEEELQAEMQRERELLERRILHDEGDGG